MEEPSVANSVSIIAIRERKMLKLIDLIRSAGIELDTFKIHFASGKEVSALERYIDGSFMKWQERQRRRCFGRKYVLSLIHLGGHRWLFAGLYKVRGINKGMWEKKPCYFYDMIEIDNLEHLSGRAIIRFDKTFRYFYPNGEEYSDKLIVAAIREQRMTIGEFPGFNNILLSHTSLKTIVRESTPSWKTVLSNVAGVYVITDRKNGKLYVGSAYGAGGIWDRWADYAKIGHGGNKELKRILRENGTDYAQNFQFSILEVCDLNSSNDYVLGRETHWKDVLLTRKSGLNKN